MTAYYNEIEPYAAAWLRNLIAEGLIAPGDVDERSIVDVQPGDLAGYTQCHFFAGIGGWSLALRVAGWPDDRPVWTGSCPCQPFSVAGNRKGFDDERHLWPEFRRLIEKRAPSVVFGEQSANAADWLGSVRGDLETVGYAVRALPIEAASAGADHFRDRYWFVADYGGERGEAGVPRPHPREARIAGEPDDEGRQLEHGSLSYSHDPQRRTDHSTRHDHGREEAERHESSGDVAERRSRDVVNLARLGWGEGWAEHEFRSRGFTAAVAGIGNGQFIECPDGKWRRLPPPSVRWLGIGVPSRVDKLRAIGNAIDWRPAAAFIQAYLEAPAEPASPGAAMFDVSAPGDADRHG